MATAGYVFPLKPSSNLWTRSLQRQTQILYTPDISAILLLMDLKPGSIVCETGTGYFIVLNRFIKIILGSGSLTFAISSLIAPNGHLYTHDIEENRINMVKSHIEVHIAYFCFVTNCFRHQV